MPYSFQTFESFRCGRFRLSVLWLWRWCVSSERAAGGGVNWCGFSISAWCNSGRDFSKSFSDGFAGVVSDDARTSAQMPLSLFWQHPGRLAACFVAMVRRQAPGGWLRAVVPDLFNRTRRRAYAFFFDLTAVARRCWVWLWCESGKGIRNACAALKRLLHTAMSASALVAVRLRQAARIG